MLLGVNVQARLAAQEDDDAVALGGDEAEEEHVAAAAVVALQRCFTERAVGELDDDEGRVGGWDLSGCSVASLCLERTRCVTMWLPLVPLRLLQNHLLHMLHLTTYSGLCRPQ